MTSRSSFLFRVSLSTIVVASLILPSVGFAATVKKVVAVKKKTVARYDLYNPRRTYKDEKVTIKNPTSRCNTASMRAAHEKNIARAERDIGEIDLSASSTTPESKAARTYLKGLTVLWDAMKEPYCGFGAYGVNAARKSYNKNVNRLRTTFSNEIKRLKKVIVVKK